MKWVYYKPVPVPIIINAVNGDSEAISLVIKNYERYIAALSAIRGYGLNRDIEERLKAKLITKLSKFRIG